MGSPQFPSLLAHRLCFEGLKILAVVRDVSLVKMSLALNFMQWNEVGTTNHGRSVEQAT